MSPAFRRYLDLMDEMRRAREEHADDATACESAERLIDDELDGLWEKLSSGEQDIVRGEAWRALPDQYAQRQRAPIPLKDTPVRLRRGFAPRLSISHKSCQGWVLYSGNDEPG